MLKQKKNSLPKSLKAPRPILMSSNTVETSETQTEAFEKVVEEMLRESDVVSRMGDYLRNFAFKNIRYEQEVPSNTLGGRRRVDIYAEKDGTIYYIECKGDSDGRISSIKQNIDLLLGKIVSLLGSRDDVEIWGVIPKHWIEHIPFNIEHLKLEFNAEQEIFHLLLMDLDGCLEEFNFRHDIFLIAPELAFDFKNPKIRRLFSYNYKQIFLVIHFGSRLISKIQDLVDRNHDLPLEKLIDILPFSAEETIDLRDRFPVSEDLILDITEDIKRHFFLNIEILRKFLQFAIKEGIINAYMEENHIYSITQ